VEYEMGWECTTHDEAENRRQTFGWETSRDSEDLGFDGRIILKRIVKNWVVKVWAGITGRVKIMYLRYKLFV
jgi:hypothetical protein